MPIVAVGVLCMLALGASGAESESASLGLVRPLNQVSDHARAQLGLSIAQGDEAQAVLESWQISARQACAGLNPTEASASLSRLIFEDLEIIREIEDDDLRFMLLPQVLIGRRGSCVGLVSLYLVLAESIGLPACAVLAPGHLFVRAGSGKQRRNIELLRRGETMDDGWYRQKYGVPDGVGAYMRCLSSREFLAVVGYNLADELRTRGLVQDALLLWTQVLAQFPGFPEAHANLGLAHHLLDDLASARVEYLEALRLHPRLPGLLHNLVLVILESSYFKGILGLGAGPAPAAMRP